ncbi:MAG: M56 family metallopeptidase [Dokdonella sp.]
MGTFIGEWADAISALAWTLVHFVWQGGLIAALFFLARSAIPLERCEARYRLGLAALALMAVCPLLTYTIEFTTTASVVGLESNSIGALTAPPLLASANTSDSLVGLSAMDIVANAAPAPDSFAPWLIWCVFFWAAGVVFTALRAWLQWRSLYGIVSRVAVPDQALQQMADRLLQGFGGVGRVRVLISAHIDTPALIGWIKPMILLPVAVALQFPRNQLELILAHELGHYCRHDAWINFAQTVLETILFYHPAVHWVSREVRNERELCCDRFVLCQTTHQPSEYARVLAALAEMSQSHVPLVMAATDGNLLDRVRRILSLSEPRSVRASARFGAALVLAAGVILVGLMAFPGSRFDSEQSVLSSDQNAGDFQSTELKSRLASLVAPVAEQSAAGLASSLMSVGDVPMATVKRQLPIRLPARVVDAVSTLASAIPAVVSTRDLTRGALLATSQPQPVPALADVSRTGNYISMHSESSAAPLANAAANISTPESVKAPVLQSVAVLPQVPEQAQQTRLSAHVDQGSNKSEAPRKTTEMAASVELAFVVGEDGRARDITVIGGDQYSALADGARREVTGRRFDLRAWPTSTMLRIRQTYISGGPGASRGGELIVDAACRMRTGSRICRQPVGEASAELSGNPPRAALVDRRVADRSNQLIVDSSCRMHAGSRNCQKQIGEATAQLDAEAARAALIDGNGSRATGPKPPGRG